MEVKKGYKQTEISVIPEDWEGVPLKECLVLLTDFEANGSFENVANNVNIFDSENFAWYVRATDLEQNSDMSSVKFVDEATYKFLQKTKLFGNEVLITKRGEIGKVYFFKMKTAHATLAPNMYLLKLNEKVVPFYIYSFFKSSFGYKVLLEKNASSTLGALYKDDVKSICVPLPPTKSEQDAIATVLFDVDTLISNLEKLITKKRNIKQGTMQELLKPKNGWEVKTIDDVAVCLDSLRVPLNEKQRLTMKGDIPYCGANGVLDFINDYCVDDEIILIAEDGGYFDEYSTRPIAYKIAGKCWVNNHAHILKAKEHIYQDFVFYSLVHKNILRFLASGTRAKLNKSEMYKIEINTPNDKDEQVAIATILSDMDTEIALLETKLAKYKMIKQGMMQTLLTGKIRLV